jgi:hypothetical protein
MSMRVVTAAAAVTALIVLAVALTDLSFQRAVLLAPVLVIGVAAVAGLLVFWGRVGWESFRASSHKRLIAIAVTVTLVVLTVLTLLGVELPRE